MESDSNKWFRDKWNKFDQSKYMEDIILDKHLKIDKKIRNEKK